MIYELQTLAPKKQNVQVAWGQLYQLKGRNDVNEQLKLSRFHIHHSLSALWTFAGHHFIELFAPKCVRFLLYNICLVGLWWHFCMSPFMMLRNWVAISLTVQVCKCHKNPTAKLLRLKLSSSQQLCSACV